MAKSKADNPHPTLYEILESVNTLGYKGRGKPVTPVEGMKPKGISLKEGLTTLSPEQMLTLRIPIQRVEPGVINGYQRHLNAARAREFARWLQVNPDYLRVLGTVEVSIDTDGNAYLTDGQHRAAGAVMAKMPLRAILTRRTDDEARRLFALQAKASRPNRNVLIFDSDGIFEEYIQDAVTNVNHPWHALVTSAQQGTSKTRMSATAAYNMLRVYVGRMGGQQMFVSAAAEERFDKDAADHLAVLMSAFGTRQSNPLAWSASGLRAIAASARLVFREREPHPGDTDRWVRHMSRFPFMQYAYLRGYTDLTEKMVAWWNKNLQAERKVQM